MHYVNGKIMVSIELKLSFNAFALSKHVVLSREGKNHKKHPTEILDLISLEYNKWKNKNLHLCLKLWAKSNLFKRKITEKNKT